MLQYKIVQVIKSIMKKSYLITLSLFIILSFNLSAHEKSATATYLGNEGVMIENGETKIVFDPFFHNNYNLYQLVSDETRDAIFSGKAPYDGLDAIFISHAHGDHFSAEDVLKFLQNNPQAKLFAPTQAVEKIMALKNSEAIKKQINGIALQKGDKEQTLKLDDLLIEVVRIPHAGWPARAEVSNLVFRVTLSNDVTIMHMGDADPNDEHFKPYKEHWLKNTTNTAFPPYWFYLSEEGPIILDERINAEKSIGIHVPVKVPESLIMVDEPYFSKPGEKQEINHKHD